MDVASQRMDRPGGILKLWHGAVDFKSDRAYANLRKEGIKFMPLREKDRKRQRRKRRKQKVAHLKQRLAETKDLDQRMRIIEKIQRISLQAQIPDH